MSVYADWNVKIEKELKLDAVTTTGYPCKIQRQVAPVVQTDNAIQCLHKLTGFPNTCPPDSDLSGG